MRASGRFWIAAAAVGAIAAGVLAGRSPPELAAAGGDEVPERVAPIQRAPPPLPRVRAPRPNVRALPKAARFVGPAFVGDPVLLSLRPRRAATVQGAAVYRSVVAPLLRALRAPSQTELRVPRGNGVRLPTASLRALATIGCPEFSTDSLARRPGVHEMCDVMGGEKPASAEVDAAFQRGEGMSFRQFKADLERRRIQYVFPQLVGKVPVEHAGLMAFRWAGETVTLVHGSVFTRFGVANRRTLSAGRAASLASRELGRLKGVSDASASRIGGELVLLPGGGARDGTGRIVPALRYAYRVLLFGFVPTPDGRVQRVSWLAWVDAGSGGILKLLPQYHFAVAQGRRWRVAPDTPVETWFFDVDPAAGGQFTLELNDTTPIFNRIDRLGNGTFGDSEASISSSSGGSGPSFANFDQAPLNDAANAVCQSGANVAFRQLNAYGHLFAGRNWMLVGGTTPSFPEAAVTVRVDAPGDGNFALYDSAGAGQSVLSFANGGGFADPACPNAAGGKLNGAQESTTLVHELSHLSTARFQERRPEAWCGTPPCAMPSGAAIFHDFADAFANAYASTPCMGGWSRRNQGSAGATANCTGTTSEGGSLPRLADLPRDRFPDHRALATGDYADGQIAAAALWSVRQGMRSKCLPSGTPQFFVRLLRALWNFGFTPSTSCAGCDLDVYRPLLDLHTQLTQQWATSGQPGGPPGFAHNGAHTTNKVTSGFARAGLFLIPHPCIDGNAATDAGSCPAASGGENGGDAVVDIDDNDPGDDVTIDGVVHPERDYLRRAGVPPTFHVWTGPRYKFDAAGNARSFTPSAATPAPCYLQYQVEVSTDPNFTGTVVTSTTGATWNTVSATTPPECFATWTMGAADWNLLKGTSGDTLLYYRVRTRDAAGTVSTERVSTRPGNGLFTVPAAYAVVRDSGTP